MDNVLAYRKQILTKFGASASEMEELLTYNHRVFEEPDAIETTRFPYPDERHISVWQDYVAQAKELGTFAILKSFIPQLGFPIEEGMSQNPIYRSACLRGSEMRPSHGLKLENPEGIRFFIHQTAAGKIPVLIFSNRQDFLSFYRAIAFKNEPKPIGDAVGAVIIGGYNNWDRIARHRSQWIASHPTNSWDEEMKTLLANKSLYQDRFIMLSDGPYSGVSGKDLGLSHDDWIDQSRMIRLEHECAHYFSKRVLSSMRNNLIDELMADYAGICATQKNFKWPWFLRFLGLEDFPAFRESGRLSQYRDNLSDGAFLILQALAVEASRQLAYFHDARSGNAPLTKESLATNLVAISRLTLEQIASSEGAVLLKEALPEPPPP